MSEPNEDSDELVTVHTCETPGEAQVAQMTLDAAGIESFLSTDDGGGELPHQGAHLIVNAADAARAAEVLKGLDRDQSAAEE